MGARSFDHEILSLSSFFLRLIKVSKYWTARHGNNENTVYVGLLREEEVAVKDDFFSF